MFPDKYIKSSPKRNPIVYGDHLDCSLGCYSIMTATTLTRARRPAEAVFTRTALLVVAAGSAPERVAEALVTPLTPVASVLKVANPLEEGKGKPVLDAPNVEKPDEKGTSVTIVPGTENAEVAPVGGVLPAGEAFVAAFAVSWNDWKLFSGVGLMAKTIPVLQWLAGMVCAQKNQRGVVGSSMVMVH